MSDEQEEKPKNVIEAIARVMAQMGGVPKMTAMMHKKRLDDAAKAAGQKPDFQPDSQIRYAYRSIDQICSMAQPLFGIYGVVIVPEVQDIKTVEFLRGEKQTRWVSTTITVKWHVYGPAGSADKIESVTYGQGDDNSDKSINKAMTTAYKNLLLRLLCIGDPKDEIDKENHGQETPSTTRTTPPPPAQQNQDSKPPAKTKTQSATDLAIMLAHKLHGGGKEDDTPTVIKAKKIVHPTLGDKDKMKPDQLDAVIQFLKVANEVKQWASCDMERALELIDVAKLAALPNHDSTILSVEDADKIIGHIQANPFEEPTL